MKSVSYLLAAGAALTLSPGTSQSAKADYFEFLNANGSNSVHITYNNGTSNENALAGAYNIQIGTTVTTGFCTAVRNNITNNDSTNSATYWNDINSSPLTSVSYNAVNNSHSQIQNEQAAAWVTKNYLHGSSTDQTSAALAIWDIINDGGDGVTVGNFRILSDSSSYQLGAQSIIDLAYGHGNVTNVAWEQTPKDSTADGAKYQDFAIDPIPEPAFYQMGAFLTGGGLLALRLRKRK